MPGNPVTRHIMQLFLNFQSSSEADSMHLEIDQLLQRLYSQQQKIHEDLQRRHAASDKKSLRLEAKIIARQIEKALHLKKRGFLD